MTYHFSKTINAGMEQAIEKVTTELKKEGFGILTEIDVQKTLKKKIDVDFKPYIILGACNPNFAYQVLQVEDKVGVFLPCNIVIQDAGKGKVEISAIDPMANMQVVANPDLKPMGLEVQALLKNIIEKL